MATDVVGWARGSNRPVSETYVNLTESYVSSPLRMFLVLRVRVGF